MTYRVRESSSDKRFWEPSAFGVFAEARTAAALVVLWIAVALFFRFVPQIDIAVTTLFFDSDAITRPGPPNRGFPLSYNPEMHLLRHVIQYSIIVLAGAMLMLVAFETVTGHSLSEQLVRAHTTILLAVLLGPVLFANGLTKAFMGRPRPTDTDLFGGDLPFVPAARYSTHCLGNCSFVSGEASAHFWLLGFLVFVPRRHLPWVAVLAFLAVSFAAALRVGFGGHYLSDVVLGGLATIVIYAMVAHGLEYARRLPWIARHLSN